MLRRRNTRPADPPPKVAVYYRATGAGQITTEPGQRVAYAMTGSWCRVVLDEGTKLLGPIDGPYTLDEANAVYLAGRQEEYDRIREARVDAWNAADYRARTILGAWANDVHPDAVAEMRKLIFQVEYGFSNESPDMLTPRPTAADTQLAFPGVDAD